MTTRSGRGGPRTPAQPAAVSGPGALSQRTDGGPTQAPSVASGGAYGERKAAEAQQAGAPMAGSGTPGPQGGGGGAPGGLAGLADVFGPTQRPNEPITAGLDDQSGMYSEADPYMMVRLAYQIYPSPSLARLLPED